MSADTQQNCFFPGPHNTRYSAGVQSEISATQAVTPSNTPNGTTPSMTSDGTTSLDLKVTWVSELQVT